MSNRHNSLEGCIAAIAIALAAIFAPAAPLSAQQLSGNIFGYVTDEQGGRLPGVSVTLTGAGAPQTVTTDSRGEYRFVNVAPGNNYTMTYEIQGFTKVTKTGVQVAVAKNTETSETMKLSKVEAAVTVRGEAATLDTRKVENGAVVDQEQLKAIPTARDPGSSCRRSPAFRWTASTSAATRAASSPSTSARARRAERVEPGRRDHHGHGGERLLGHVLRLRLVRGDQRDDRRHRHHRDHARRAVEPRDEARHERHPRLGARLPDTEVLGVAQRHRRGEDPEPRCSAAATASTRSRTTASRSAARSSRTGSGRGAPTGATRST